MARTVNRRTTAKGVLEKACGCDIERNHISASDKVTIMEYLFSCPMSEVISYNNNSMPAFIVACALLLINDQVKEYLEVLERCRLIAKQEDLIRK